jgi:hypothetical protein
MSNAHTTGATMSRRPKIRTALYVRTITAAVNTAEQRDTLEEARTGLRTQLLGPARDLYTTKQLATLTGVYDHAVAKLAHLDAGVRYLPTVQGI